MRLAFPFHRALQQLTVFQALKQFPRLKQFVDHWPVTDIVKACLHYTAAQTKKKAVEIQASTSAK
jgi:uncharacterized protein Usg